MLPSSSYAGMTTERRSAAGSAAGARAVVLGDSVADMLDLLFAKAREQGQGQDLARDALGHGQRRRADARIIEDRGLQVVRRRIVDARLDAGRLERARERIAIGDAD